MKFFTSDTHFFHTNVIKYSKRPFTSIEHMHEVIITNWNARVGRNDEVYHLGDVSFGKPEPTREILNQLNGRIFLVRGNHDKTAEHKLVCDRFEWIKDIADIKVSDPTLPKGRQLIVLCHYPMLTWKESHHGSWHLHGHSHGTLKTAQLPVATRLDVGVDPWNFAPVSYYAVSSVMKIKTMEPVDHHVPGDYNAA